MHHDVAAAVARLLAGIRVGRPQGHPTGLTVVPLEDVGGHPRALFRHATGPPEVGEMVPPRAGELFVTNRGPGMITLHQGDLFTGGLADRAALTTTVVGPSDERVLAVEPTEPRWWWTGPPVLDRALDPPMSALVALAGLDGVARAGLSAIARTCLWAIAPRGAADADLAEPHDHPTTAGRGWVLLAGAAVLATRVWDRPRRIAAWRQGTAVARADADPVARRFLASLARARWNAAVPGAGAGEIAGHHAVATLHEGRIVELGTVRLSEELADALRRAPSRGRTPVR